MAHTLLALALRFTWERDQKTGKLLRPIVYPSGSNVGVKIQGVVSTCLHAIPKIVPTDPKAIEILGLFASYSYRTRDSSTTIARYSLDLRTLARYNLYKIGQKQNSVRKKIVPYLLTGFAEKHGNNPKAAHPSNIEACNYLRDFGADAKQALPVLEKLKFHPDETLRMAVDEAIKAIKQ